MIRKNRNFDIKIKHYGLNIGACDLECNCIYIRKLQKEIDDYITFSIEVINHEYMHILLYKEVNGHTSRLYDTDICLTLEDRKMLTPKFINSLSNHDKK